MSSLVDNHWEACPFLKSNAGGVDGSGERGDGTSDGEGTGGEKRRETATGM